MGIKTSASVACAASSTKRWVKGRSDSGRSEEEKQVETTIVGVAGSRNSLSPMLRSGGSRVEGIMNMPLSLVGLKLSSCAGRDEAFR